MQDSFLPQQLQNSTEDMKLRPEDKKWLVDEVAEQVKDAIAKAVNEFKPHGWSRALFWLRQLGPISAVIAIIITLLGMTGAAWYQAFSRVEKETRFETKTEGRLDIIEKELKEIHEDLTKQSLISHAALSLEDFKITLPDLGSAVAKAQQQGVKVSPAVAAQISHKLADTDKTAPSFWPVAGAVIYYRSSLLTGGTLEAWQVFPPCYDPVDIDANPNISGQLLNKEGTKPEGEKFPITRVGYSDCYIELDGKRASRWDCKHCLIKYSGGPVWLRDVHFDNCLFVFILPQQAPPPEGQRLSELLLSSNLSSVEITSL